MVTVKAMSIPRLYYEHSWPMVDYDYPDWWCPTQFDNYIEETDDKLFKVSPSKVRERKRLHPSYHTRYLFRHEMGMEGVYCAMFGLQNKPHWMEFLKNRKVVQSEAAASKVTIHVLPAKCSPHLLPGRFISMNERDGIYRNLVKKHVDAMDYGQLLRDMIPIIESGVSDRGNAAYTTGINDGQNCRADKGDEVTKPQFMKETTKRDVERMVEATSMVYDVMDHLSTQDPSFQMPTILTNGLRLNEFALELCLQFGIPTIRADGRPSNIFEMNTSVATVAVQKGGRDVLYLNGKELKPYHYTCHIDHFNCPINVHVWVVYQHVRHPESGIVFRVGNVFTF